jgi:hypothetical protein
MLEKDYLELIFFVIWGILSENSDNNINILSYFD